jgi:hypothetical protein
MKLRPTLSALWVATWFLMSGDLAAAATVTFTGSILAVGEDTGTGQLAGTTVGTGFSGTFVYTGPSGPGVVDGVEAQYPLAGSFTLTRAGGPVLSGTVPTLAIFDDEPIDADTADAINGLLSPTPPVVAGQLADTWELLALQTGASIDGEDNVFGGVVLDFALISFDSTLFDSVAFRLLPPELGDADVAAFLITEGDASGTILFDGIGVITSMVAVPAPPAAWLLAAALAGLWRRRRIR